MACDLTDGRVPLPGGVSQRSGHWVVEHCVGPLGLGTLIVKPERHVVAVADLSEEEAGELGPLLRQASLVARDLTDADQVYNCLWSHAGGAPGHLHYVVQPVTKDQVEAAGAYGPALQMAMFRAGEVASSAAIEAIADRARAAFGGATA